MMEKVISGLFLFLLSSFYVAVVSLSIIGVS